VGRPHRLSGAALQAGQGVHALLAGVLPHARALGLERALLHCDETNVASARVIEGAGGVFAGLTPNLERDGAPGRAYWIAL
jgi:predicted acetyltransferase